ncbi:MAG: BatA domain-containing protein, partial [Roseiarcus sp.]
MLGLPLTFAAPAALAALVLLAALYLLLRVTPPRPREIRFPPLRLLLGLDPKDQTPHRTPWPLLLLRMAIGAAVVLAMAGPIWNAIAPGPGAGPLLL